MRPEDKIGSRLRDLRKARGMTLETLAERAGVTKGYLSKIENGKQLPPIATLSRISVVLDTDIATFFQNNDAAEDFGDRVSLVRAGERRQTVRGGSAFGYDYQSIAHGMADKSLDAFVFTFPERVEEQTDFEHEGEEMVFILSGSVKFEIAGKSLILAPGDCLYFDASLAHRGRSLNGEASALVVIYQPKPS